MDAHLICCKPVEYSAAILALLPQVGFLQSKLI